MDGGGSKQYHVLPSAKHDIKSVQGRTGLIWILTYGRNSFCEKRVSTLINHTDIALQVFRVLIKGVFLIR